MTEEWLKRIIRAAIESFPISSRRKEALLQKLLEEQKRKEHDG